MNRSIATQMNFPTASLLHTMAQRSTLFLLVVLALVIGSATSRAATIPMAMEELLAYSDEVIHGVVESEQEVMMYEGKIFTVSTVRIEESLKGDKTADSTIQIAIPGGEIGFLGMKATNTAVLQPEEEVVLFLSTEHPRRLAQISRTRGTTADFSHPVSGSPQIIGGFQGKLNVVRREELRESDGLRSVENVARVVRHVPGRSLEIEDFPTLTDFNDAIGKASAPDAPVRTSVRIMPGAPAVDIPERNPEARALRAFDSFVSRETSSSSPPPSVPVERIPLRDAHAEPAPN